MNKGLMLECLLLFSHDAVTAEEVDEYKVKVLNTYQNMIGLPKAAFRLTEHAKIAASGVDVRIGLSDGAIAKTEGAAQPISTFTHAIQVRMTTEVSLDAHLAKQLPARNYLPMAIDVSDLEALGPNAIPLFFELLDVVYAFQQKVQLAADQMMTVHLAGLEQHAPLIYARVISSYLMSLREDELADPQATSRSSNSPCPLIFYVQLAFKLHQAFEK